MGSQRSAGDVHRRASQIFRGHALTQLARAFALAWLAFVVSLASEASGPVSPRYSHPIDWMYQLPVGEAPGWTSRFWMDIQASESNVWTRPTTVVDRETGRTFEYDVDFQASILILETGFALTENTAFIVELPYMRRHGGNTDQFIEDWHESLNFYGYLRPYYPDDQSHFRARVDGVTTYESEGAVDGLSSVKLKLKHRLIKAGGAGCPCGLSVSAQANLPVNGDRHALSSGSTAYSFLAHAGIPVGSESGIYLTTGFSFLGDNPVLREWPMNKTTAMGDLSFDLGLVGGWGFLMSFSTYSPWMKSRFDFVGSTDDPKMTKHERISSAYNSLFRWRGYQNYGLRYRWGKSGSQFSVFLFEDFGFGDYDGRRDIVYNNNSPDVLLGTQLSLRF